MRNYLFRIIVVVLLLSLAAPAAPLPVMARLETPPALEPTSIEPYRYDPIDESMITEGYDFQHRGFPPELMERYPYKSAEREERVYIAPTVEVVALTQQQVESFNCSAITDVLQTECEALVALYDSTNGAGWGDSTNWLTGTAVGSWYGVMVDDAHVTSVTLKTNNLNGVIPAALSDLSNLYVLDLGINFLSGVIPAALGNLSNLDRLHLNYNYLSGSIPTELGNLNNLRYFYLHENQLTGSIPTELGNLNNLQVIDLFYNQLSGSIPTSLGNLTKLWGLDLSGNQLSDGIPSSLGNLSNLEALDLSVNQLGGNIPTSLGNLSNLKGLALNENQLSGSIPAELGNLTYLWKLDLSDNQLSGSIPTSLGNLTKLEELELYGNQLSGSIPAELGNLTNLYHLDLGNNMFSGDVPPSFTNLVNLCEPDNWDEPCYGVYELDLGYNHLNVPAPEPPASFLEVKDPDWYLTQAVEKDITGETGGTIISNDGNTKIDIPAGAFTGTLTFLFAPKPAPSQNIGDLNFAGNSFELTASVGDVPVTTFAKPLSLTLHYDEALLGTIPEVSLRLYYWDTDQLNWVDAASTCVDGEYIRNLDENWLSLPVCHLSEFGLMSDTENTYLPMIQR